MSSIRKANQKDAEMLSKLGRKTFLEAHERSAPADVLAIYMQQKNSVEILIKELADPLIHYYILEYEGQPVGYSKIIFNYPCESVSEKNITKLDRIYLLEALNGKGLGFKLYQFNVELAKKNDQIGMWLYTWTENQKAIQFYSKVGFNIVGSYLFKIDETHSNPNHIMYCAF